MLLAWIQTEVDLLTLLQDTGPVARGVIAILIVFSIWSWGIILSKTLLFRKVEKESRHFWNMFRKGRNLTEISTACETLRFTPLVPVFDSAVEVLQPRAPVRSPGGGVAVKARIGAAAVQRAMQRTAVAQLTLLERRLNFLATTASVTPFVGLFGTVWGVLTAFMGLGNTQTATLRAVAPGIAEALLTTAFGLFTAIPAVIAYNQLVYRLRNIGGQMDDLQAEVLTMAEGDEG